MQLDTRQQGDLEAGLDKCPTEAHVDDPAQRDMPSLRPQLDCRAYAFALSPSVFHNFRNARAVPVPPRLGGMGFRH